MKKGRDSRAVANCFVKLAAAAKKPLTIMPLVKYVYLAHGWHLGYHGEPLIFHAVEAWRHGPVVPEVYSAFRPRGLVVSGPAIKPNPPFGAYDADFSDTEREIIEQVFDAYSPLHPFVISELTHEPGTPWDQVKDKGFYAAIPNDIIRAYYRKKTKREQ